jgi:hypothetical protein
MRPFILFCLLANAALASETLYDSKEYAFTIRPPVDGADQSVQAALFCLPASDGFAANVNVQIQVYPGSRADYDKLTRQQLDQFKFKLISSHDDGDALVYEYAGAMGANKLHWYARAIKRGEKVYVITGTALEKSWESQSGLLIDSVDSFSLKN